LIRPRHGKGKKGKEDNPASMATHFESPFLPTTFFGALVVLFALLAADLVVLGFFARWTALKRTINDGLLEIRIPNYFIITE
jgi:uncharacterized membrane protein YphA (DoxX/SURF4 family)